MDGDVAATIRCARRVCDGTFQHLQGPVEDFPHQIRCRHLPRRCALKSASYRLMWEIIGYKPKQAKTRIRPLNPLADATFKEAGEDTAHIFGWERYLRVSNLWPRGGMVITRLMSETPRSTQCSNRWFNMDPFLPDQVSRGWTRCSPKLDARQAG